MRLKLMMFLVVILTGFLPCSLKAEVDLTALTQETQKMSQSPDELTMVWWLPEEFWSASAAQNPQATAESTEELLKVTRPYVMIVVVDGNFGAFGGVTYKSEEYIRANVRLVDAQGKSYAPLTADEASADVKNMLQIFKPILVNMLGPMGQNCQFVLFPANNSSGQPIAAAKQKGSFKITIDKKEFKWRLPLDSLLPVQTCSACKQDCKGSWSYCPWCGAKLTSSSR